MACEHILQGKYPLCTVVRGLMTPSLREMRAYCTSDHPSACPLYRQYAASREKVPLETAAALIGGGPFDFASRATSPASSLHVDRQAPTPLRSWRSDARR